MHKFYPCQIFALNFHLCGRKIARTILRSVYKIYVCDNYIHRARTWQISIENITECLFTLLAVAHACKQNSLVQLKVSVQKCHLPFWVHRLLCAQIT